MTPVAKNFVALALAFVAQAAFADGASPSGREDDSVRCRSDLAPAQCAEMRERALAQHCIDYPTYDRLRAENRGPICLDGHYAGACTCH